MIRQQWPNLPKFIGALLLGAGILSVGAAWGADILEYGKSPDDIGYSQISLMIAGALIALAGFAILRTPAEHSWQLAVEFVQSPKRQPSPTFSINYRFVVYLLAIILLGTWLRFRDLQSQSLWYDELESWKRSNYDSLAEVINEGAWPEPWPPGYHVFLFFVQKLIGDSEFILRFPSALSGILAIAVIFKTGQRLYSYREGLLAAAFTSILWCPIYYSQEARAYSMLMFAALWACYFWILIQRCFERKVPLSWYTMLGYVVAAIAASYLHYYGLYLILLQGLATLLRFRQRKQILIYTVFLYSSVGLAYLPWSAALMHDLLSAGSWSEPPGNLLATGSYFLSFLFNESRVLVGLVIVTYCIGAVSTVFPCKKNKIPTPSLASPSWFLIGWLLIPFLGEYLTARYWFPTPLVHRYFRYLIISAPAAYLLLARSISIFPLRSRYRIVAGIAFCGLFLFHLFWPMQYYSGPHKTQFREAVSYVAEHETLDGDTLIIGFTGWVTETGLFDYYFKQSGSLQAIDMKGGHSADIPLVAARILNDDPLYIWFIAAHEHPSPDFVQYLDQHFELVEYEAFHEAEAWLFRRD